MKLTKAQQLLIVDALDYVANAYGELDGDDPDFKESYPVIARSVKAETLEDRCHTLSQRLLDAVVDEEDVTA